MNTPNRFNTLVFLFVFIMVLIFNLYIFKGMFHALAFAAILAGAFYPLFKWFQNHFKMKRELASLSTTLVVILALILPLLYIIFQISRESIGLYSQLKEGLSKEAVRQFLFGDGPIAQTLESILALIDSSLSKEEIYQILLVKVQSYSGLALNTVNGLIGDTFTFLFQFLLMTLALYGLFIEGENLKAYVFKLSPLPNEQEQLILEKFNQMNFVTLVGNGVGGLIQGGLAGIAFWVAGIPSIFLWTTTMIILAFIPLIGISIVTIPASLYLYITGAKSAGIALFAFTTIIGLVVENWFKPRFIGPRVRVNSLILLFYIIAGMGVFGMAGIFYGPLLCVIFLTMVEIFLNNYLPQLQKN
jgi:predicted PurR-regulated permease PerM